MNTQTLSLIAKLKRKKPSDLAKMAGVSRAAVSLWLKKTEADLRAQNLHALADGLGVSMEDLMKPLPILEDAVETSRLEASLLWDKAFRSLGEFAIALSRKNHRAIARLIEVYGLFHAEKVVGKTAWKDFDKYKNHIHPVRRKECENLCRELKRLELI